MNLMNLYESLKTRKYRVKAFNNSKAFIEYSNGMDDIIIKLLKYIIQIKSVKC